MSDSANDLVRTISEMVEMTRQGKMAWRRASTSAFVFDSPGEPSSRVIIQRFPEHSRYRFWIMSDAKMVMNVVKGETEPVGSTLKSLFASIERKMEEAHLKQGVDVLGGILKKLK